MPKRNLFIALLFASIAWPAPAQDNDARLTIKLDAESTEANGIDGGISFRGVTITQGETYIKADEASSSGLDFRNSTWTFTGEVRFGARGTTASAQQAILEFREQELVSATLTGEPVNVSQSAQARVDLSSKRARLEFENGALSKAQFKGNPVLYRQRSDELTTDAHADLLLFDAVAGVVTLQENAWISEGSREITGNRISYNYVSRNVVAAGDENERVTITIAPPSESKTPSESE